MNTEPAVLMPEIDFANDDLPNLPEILEELRSHGPVVPIKYMGTLAWTMLDHADVDRGFNDYVNFNTAEIYKIIAEPSMGRNLTMMEGEEHRQHRALVSERFMPRAMRSNVEKLIEPVAHELLDRIEGKEQVDLVASFARPFPFTVITRLLNIPVSDEKLLLEWAIKLLEYPWDPKGALAARDAFDVYIQRLITARRRDPTGDFISQLVTSDHEGNKLSDQDIATFCRLLFPAGSDTTFKGVGSLFSYVLKDDDLRAQAQRSDNDRHAIVSESLRLQPPLVMQIRMASRDVQIGNAAIRRGERVLFCIMAANRDPKVFADPDKFDAARDNRQLTTFGRNIHFCLGMHLARREMETALKTVLERFPKMRLVPDARVDIVGGVLRGPRELWVSPGSHP